MSDYYGVSRSEAYLEHYGVKGMKWGVRKAIQSGNDRALGRQYRKAAKKLAKLEKRAASGKKYAKRAAALGAGAALAGGVAATGTKGISAVTRGAGRIGGTITNTAGLGAMKVAGVMQKAGIRGAGRVRTAGRAMYTAGNKVIGATSGAGNAIDRWGASHSLGEGARRTAQGALKRTMMGNNGTAKSILSGVNEKLTGSGHANLYQQADKLGKVSNSGYARLGAAAAGAGLAAGAGYNAYRAATTKRAAKKAAAFKKEMQSAFKGTKYANQVGTSRKRKRR